jgi:hypothetical protein
VIFLSSEKTSGLFQKLDHYRDSSDQVKEDEMGRVLALMGKRSEVLESSGRKT